MEQPIAALEQKGLCVIADELRAMCGQGRKDTWEEYARKTFLGLAALIPKCGNEPRLRFLQYVNKQSEAWWREHVSQDAVLLGRHGPC